MIKKTFSLFLAFMFVFLIMPQKISAEVLDWEAMVNSTKTGVQKPGFGDESNVFVTSMATLDDYLYVATYNNDRGTEIWRTSQGDDWEQVNSDGFGSHTTSFAILKVFNNYLYAFNTGAGQDHIHIFRTSNGSTWTQAATINDMTSPTSAAVYGNKIYVSLSDFTDTGATVFSSSNGTAWAQINVTGFGDANNLAIQSMAVFDNELYAGTYNDVTGTEVWHYDGANWDIDNTEGFDNAENYSTGGLTKLGNYLYAATWNETTGVEVWRTPGDQTWEKVSDEGFDEGLQAAVAYEGILFGDYLYFGTSGSQIFRSSDGTNWEKVNENGFGFEDNELITFGILGDYLYAGVGSVPELLVATVEIYRYGTPTPEPEPVETLPQTGADL